MVKSIRIAFFVTPIVFLIAYLIGTPGSVLGIWFFKYPQELVARVGVTLFAIVIVVVWWVILRMLDRLLSAFTGLQASSGFRAVTFFIVGFVSTDVGNAVNLDVTPLTPELVIACLVGVAALLGEPVVALLLGVCADLLLRLILELPDTDTIALKFGLLFVVGPILLSIPIHAIRRTTGRGDTPNG